MRLVTQRPYACGWILYALATAMYVEQLFPATTLNSQQFVIDRSIHSYTQLPQNARLMSKNMLAGNSQYKIIHTQCIWWTLQPNTSFMWHMICVKRFHKDARSIRAIITIVVINQSIIRYRRLPKAPQIVGPFMFSSPKRIVKVIIMCLRQLAKK